MIELCRQFELTKGQIDQIEEAVNKAGSSYFGDGEDRYKRNISDNGLLIVNVDDMMQSIPKEAWVIVENLIKVDVKSLIEAQKLPYGELTRKPEDERNSYKEPAVKWI